MARRTMLDYVEECKRIAGDREVDDTAAVQAALDAGWVMLGTMRHATGVVTRAGTLEAIRTLALEDHITAEQAREMLDESAESGVGVVGASSPTRRPAELCAGAWSDGGPLFHYCGQPMGHPGRCSTAAPSKSVLYDKPANTLFDAPVQRLIAADVYPVIEGEVCECFAANLCAEHALDVEYDGVSLRELLAMDADARHEGCLGSYVRPLFTPSQRAAVSAHWSAELRKRVEAAKERGRRQVVLEVDDE